MYISFFLTTFRIFISCPERVSRVQVGLNLTRRRTYIYIAKYASRRTSVVFYYRLQRKFTIPTYTNNKLGKTHSSSVLGPHVLMFLRIISRVEKTNGQISCSDHCL